MTGSLRVVIADDHDLVREGVRHALERSDQIGAVAVVGDASQRAASTGPPPPGRPPRLTLARAGRGLLAAGLLSLLAPAVVACSSNDPTPTEESDLNDQLIDAAWANDIARARELIADGADVNHQDGTRQSAYLIATSEGYLELLELTLDHGADVTSLDGFNGTGLIRAAERGHADVVERLLATDIDVDHINNLGWTALHEAIILGDGSQRYVRTIQLLLDHGADPTLATGDDQTPLELAEGRGQADVIEILRDALSGRRA